MKRLLILLVGSIVLAKQRVERYRYDFPWLVASGAKTDLENLISKGFKIVSFSLGYQQACMIVVYDDMEEE